MDLADISGWGMQKHKDHSDLLIESVTIFSHNNKSIFALLTFVTLMRCVVLYVSHMLLDA